MNRLMPKYRYLSFGISSLLLVLSVLLSSCTLTQIKPFTTETYELPEFSSLVIHGMGQVTITGGENNSLTIVAEPGIFPEITYSVSNGTLFLNVPDGLTYASFDPRLSIQFLVSAKNLRSIQNFGTCTITGTDLSGKTLLITQDAVSDVNLSNLTFDNIELNASGGGNIILNGNINQQTISLDGTVSYSSGDVSSRRIDAKLSGKTRALVWVTDILNVETSENSLFQFFGLPLNTYLGLHPANIQALGQK